MVRRTPTEASRGREWRRAQDEAALRVLRQFRQVFNAVKTHFQQVEKKVGLGGAQVWALRVIQESPGIGIGALALAMDIHPSTASNLVRALVERELVSVSRNADDRRTSQLKLLPGASRLLRRAPAPHAGVLPEALAALDPNTLKRVERDLAKLIDVLRVDQRSARIPLADL